MNLFRVSPEKESKDLYGLKRLLERNGLEVEMRDHPLYTEGIELGNLWLAYVVGTDQLIVSTNRFSVSVIRGWISGGLFEIFCLKGNLFEDVERYGNEEQCCQRIIDLFFFKNL